MNTPTTEERQRQVAEDIRDAAVVLEAALNRAEQVGVIVSCQVETGSLLSPGSAKNIHRVRTVTTVAI